MKPPNSPIVITGCQRSGTTLLNLILDSHPAIKGVDESQFDARFINHYLGSKDYHPFVCFKEPTSSHSIKFFQAISTMKILWCSRNIRDVVASMLSLKLNAGGDKAIWALHPYGALREISNLLPVIQKFNLTLTPREIDTFKSIENKSLERRSRQDAVFCAAWCWKLKRLLPEIYKNQSINYMVIEYEKLTAWPRQTLEEIVGFLGITWHDYLLRHHELHSGVSVGNTINTRPIDPNNNDKWRGVLTRKDLQVLSDLCPDESIVPTEGH